MKKSVQTLFPAGTIVKFGGIPCKLLQDVPYYSETFRGERHITSRYTLTGKAGAFWNKLKLLVGFSGR